MNDYKKGKRPDAPFNFGDRVYFIHDSDRSDSATVVECRPGDRYTLVETSRGLIFRYRTDWLSL